MPGLSNQYRTLVLDDWFGDTRATPRATQNGTFADIYASFATAPPGPNCDQNLATETRRIYCPMTGPATNGTTHLLQMTLAALVSLNNWLAPGQDTPETLTDYILWNGPESDNTAIPIGRGPMGGFPYEACSVDSVTNKLTSKNHGYTDGNSIEVFAVPLQDPTMPGYLIRPDTRYVALNCTGPDFQLALPGTPTVPVAVGADGSLLAVRAKRHTIDMGGLFEIPAGQLALPII